MEFFYITFALICVLAECSSKINTRNIFKKIGLAMIVLGSFVELSGHENNMLEFGAMIYILADVYKKLNEYAKLHKG